MAQVSEQAKKARDTKSAGKFSLVPLESSSNSPSIAESDAQDHPELQVVVSKSKASKRKYPAPTINIDSDESEPKSVKKSIHIDFANPPLYPVNKIKAVTQKVKKPVAAKAPKAVAFAKSTAKTVTPRAAPVKPTTGKSLVELDLPKYQLMESYKDPYIFA
ncbi:hypothetical protein B0H10DRAFT_1957574 [Mycena sp. CBHHK59/15]|nr:hypothetical protein B0H10DRAFT_1957574 [Mycena sp. CBHHK59/15]